METIEKEKFKMKCENLKQIMKQFSEQIIRNIPEIPEIKSLIVLVGGNFSSEQKLILKNIFGEGYRKFSFCERIRILFKGE
ncbi:MAG: hypothetical protein PHN88_02760 [Ignavibacteria bacterium]|nr:hypothetical protein [Ignavibacteria bacterium]